MNGAAEDTCSVPRLRRHLVDGIFVAETLPPFQPVGAPPIVFLHGAFQGAWVYEPWQRQFAAFGWRTLALSLRNHPGSMLLDPPAFVGLGPQDYVDDVLRVADWVGGPFVLVGHSMGAIIAQKAAERLPELAALVLLGAGAAKGLGASRPKDLPSDRVAIPHYDQVRRHMFGSMPDADYAAIYARLVPETPGVINRTGRGRVAVAPERLQAPVLAVDAELDRNRFAEAYARLYGGEYLVVPGARHALMLGDWGPATASAVNSWLALRALGFQYDHRPAWQRPGHSATPA
jgi:pimeloyl-ACP methyl ester carboxylesterase